MTQDTKENSMPHVDEGMLHAYLDGELPSAERKTLETHLAECASCRTQLAEERALLERASALLGATRPAERPVPPFEQLRPTPRALKRSAWRVRTPVAWAASIALALGLGYYLHEPGAPPAGSMPEQQNLTLYRSEPQAEESKPAPVTTTLRPARKVAAAPAPTVATIPPGRRDSATAATAGARADSGVALDREEGKAAAGVVAILPRDATPQLRNAAPPAVASVSKANDSIQLHEALIIVDGAQVSSAAASRGPTTTTWPIISRGAARSLLGTDPVGLPGLARQIRRSPANDGTVLVEQKIDSATTIQIFQQQNATAGFYYRRNDTSVSADKARRSQERDLAVAPADRLARYVGRLRVEIAGPLSSDSLNKLLDQVQPLP